MAVVFVSVLVVASSVAFSQQSMVPDWLKITAGWWSQNLVGDDDFIRVVAWLVDNGYIVTDSEDKNQIILREDKYSIMQPSGWEWQTPLRDDPILGTLDRMIMRDTIDEDVPSAISVSTVAMKGDTLEAHREWGLVLVDDILGDAFNHTSATSTVVLGNPGYIDEYTVNIPKIQIQGKSYNFVHDGIVYEIKYETDAKSYEKYLSVFEDVMDTFMLM